MPRRFRRPAAATLGAVLLVPALAACGDNSSTATDTTDTSSSASTSSSSSASASSTESAGSAADALSAVSFGGQVGKELSATWHSTIASPTSTTVTTLVKGTGATVASGDTVSTYLWVGDGTTKKVAYSDYTNGKPESIPNNGKLSDLFTKLLTGSTYGSRVVAVTTPMELLGTSTGSAQLGIGANDSLVVVADVVSKAAVAPTPTDDKVHDASPASQPKVVLKNGKPTGLDFTGIKKPALTTPVQRVVLTQGTGAVVKATDTLTVNYLGEIYQAKAPFDESYSKKTPLTSALSGLIPGWSTGLTGVKVGSRVLLQIPPAAGYGAEGSGSTIPGNSTLWFVIDIVKAS